MAIVLFGLNNQIKLLMEVSVYWLQESEFCSPGMHVEEAGVILRGANKNGVEDARSIRWWLDVSVLVNGLDRWGHQNRVQFGVLSSGMAA